jgi:hypothetical protein
MSDNLIKSKEIRDAFIEYDKKAILSNVIIGCFIGIILVPFGSLLDFYVYRLHFLYFLKLRLFCSLLIIIFLAIVKSPFGKSYPRLFGVLLAFLPAGICAWMIYATEGTASSYYAGLNLVLLVIGYVLHWTVIESLIVVFGVVLMYMSYQRIYLTIYTFSLSLVSLLLWVVISIVKHVFENLLFNTN